MQTVRIAFESILTFLQKRKEEIRILVKIIEGGVTQLTDTAKDRRDRGKL